MSLVVRSRRSRARRRAGILRELYRPARALLFLRLLLFLVVLPRLMRIPLPRLLPFFDPRTDPRDPDPARMARIIRYTDYLLLGRGPFPKKTCLPRSLTLYYFLRREGLDLSVHIGVAEPNGGSIAGHCWLMKDGKPFLEQEDPGTRFSPIYSFPPSGDPGRA